MSELDVPDSIRDVLKSLKNKRAFLKRNLTVMQKHLADFNNTREDVDKSNRQFELCQRTLNNYSAFLEDNYNDDYSEQFEEFFLENDISSLFSIVKVQVTRIAEQNATNLQATQASAFHTPIKLPSIVLPTFTGKYEDWLSFKDKFYSLIDANPSIQKMQKLQYLTSALSGDAHNVLKYLEITECNYEIALKLLHDRFENKRVIIKSHLKSLFDFPNLTKDSHIAVRKLLDSFTQHLRALASLGRPVEHWDDLVTYLMISKLPHNIRCEWEEKLQTSDAPTMEQLQSFLNSKCHALEFSSFKDSNVRRVNFNDRKPIACGAFENKSKQCLFCNERHYIYQCQKFSDLDVKERLRTIESKRACLNCLKLGHVQSSCKSSHCKHCNKNHNTLLHLESRSTAESSNSNPEGATSCVSSYNVATSVLLSTCVVNVLDNCGNLHEIRVMLDSGSQINFITQETVDLLGLNTRDVVLSITGINNKNSVVKKSVQATLKSQHNNFEVNLLFYVLENITNPVPSQSLKADIIHVPKNANLADSTFYKSRKIDALLGAEIFYKLLCVGQIQTNQPGIILQKSLFGWIVSGKLNNPQRAPMSCNLSVLQSLEDSIKRFWELEQNPSRERVFSSEEQDCETHFKQTSRRDKDGRFIVSLPWKGDPQLLGDSYIFAKRRLYSVERKLERDPRLKEHYNEFMTEYLNMNHMVKITESVKANDVGYYLPHHAVLKNDSLTTKVRVVFDASLKTTSGKSLNDLLMVGPKLQQDIFSILLRFRTYQYVITSDIAKMYRQVRIVEHDKKYQRILWRFNKEDPIDIFELQTVTYGTSSASFLATRCLQEIASEVEPKDPKLSKIISSDFYMDDLLTGADTLNELDGIRKGVSCLLQSAGFELRKWASNSGDILSSLSHASDKNFVLHFESEEHLKTLGVFWIPCTDQIQYYASLPTHNNKVTKRTILSDMARIFDPLGLLGPTIVVAKLLMQKLWQLNTSWDESVPLQINTSWQQFLNELKVLSEIKINRKIIRHSNCTYEIHGFCDASCAAYGACVFLKSISLNGELTVELMCSKSRVAPLKTVTLPRLELCAAELLAQLVSRVKESLRIEIVRTYYYSDSTITLAWLKSCPTRWSTFVSHRVSNIQRLSEQENWFHVAGDDNPADCLSRGILPRKLQHSELWWHGPQWLRHDVVSFHEPVMHEELPEARALIVTPNKPDVTLWHENYSNLSKLIRITAFIKRFLHNCIKSEHKLSGPLSVRELKQAELSLIKSIQGQHFSKEILILKNSQDLPRNNKLSCLNPFLDELDVLRVGGRLKYSDLKYETKFPILVPNNCHFTVILIKREHRLTLHGGVQTTLAKLRENYWLVNGKGSIRKILHECIACFKAKPVRSEPIMGHLPNARTDKTRPFFSTGVDYFGPLYIKEGSRRSSRLVKAYGAIFVCMAVKAVHIELVSNLSTEAFLATLKRFIARRGCVKHIYSDNATNFTGANKELRDIYSFFSSEVTKLNLADHLSKYEVEWHYIPPRAPHFGGLWESAVRSTKWHLNRIVSKAHLNFEEMSTLLAQIESILNSRPLIPLSNDPNDYSFLTPSHFLNCERGDAMLDIDLRNSPMNRLSRWQRVQQLHQHFWARWRREYLSNLQRRNKWGQTKGPDLKLGQLVLISEDGTPSNQWITGRVIDIHPGKEGVVRAATVRTSNGTFKRPTVKLCVLPLNGDE